jgi:aminopeptidase N
MAFSAFAQNMMIRKADDDLTLLLAHQRKSQIKKIEYFLHFNLDHNAEGYRGQTRMEIELNRIDLPLSVDYLGKKIHSVKVNGVEVKKYPSRKGSFDIPQKLLSQKLSVEIDYENEYSKEASGFQHVKDPEDGAEYVYSDFEPYHAHKLFPCLDQPDLKAIYKVTVSAPKEWKVIQNELVEKEEEQGAKTLTTFKSTPPLSTYLFFLGAGPFVEWKETLGNLPIYLYARKSMAKYVDVDNIMKTTKAGIKFYNEYFDYPYPFSKYGQVFIPEFAWGGMENPGAISLNERNIFRGPVPQAKYEDRNNLILHEMAHMWFGDLVTMEWWNDLWLNESFATYMASIAQEKALDSKWTWQDFFMTKSWGYWQDELVTTHSIETNVPDVRTAKSNFDGITYAKGASALKQLHFFAGDDGFRNGLRSYFKSYAWSNTKRENFINAIALAAKMDLSDWTAKWLQTAGPHRVKVEFECKKGKVTKGTLLQKANVSKVFSPHRARVALYNLKDEKLALSKTADIFYSTASTEIKDFLGGPCPDFVFPNADDKDYALFSLDEKSLAHAELALKTINDPLTRLMIWHMLTEMVRDQLLSPTKLFEIGIPALKTEEEDLLLGNLLGRHSFIREQPYFLYLTKKERAKIAPDLETVIWERIEKAGKGSSLQMTFFDFYLTIAQTPVSQQRIYDMLVKNTPPEGITLDQDRRWAAIINLAENGHAETQKLISDEVKKDSTTKGKRQALVARAAFPSKAEKKAMWKELFTNEDLTHSDLEEAGEKMFNPNHPEVGIPFVADYFKRISKMAWKSHDDVVDIYFEKLFPFPLCSKDVEKMSDAYYKKAQKLSSIARRGWREAQDELSRCVRVRGGVKSNPQKF